MTYPIVNHENAKQHRTPKKGENSTAPLSAVCEDNFFAKREEVELDSCLGRAWETKTFGSRLTFFKAEACIPKLWPHGRNGTSSNRNRISQDGVVGYWPKLLKLFVG